MAEPPEAPEVDQQRAPLDMATALAWAADAPVLQGGMPETAGLSDLARTAYVVHGMMHAVPAQASCRRGCSVCCHQAVGMSPAEAFLLADAVRRDGLRGRFRQAYLRDAAMDGMQHRRWLMERIPCPLLGADGACLSYRHRPLVCREHLVSSPAELCGVPDGVGINLLLREPRLSHALSAVCADLRGGRTEVVHLPLMFIWIRRHRSLAARRWPRARLLGLLAARLPRP